MIKPTSAVLTGSGILEILAKSYAEDDMIDFFKQALGAASRGVIPSFAYNVLVTRLLRGPQAYRCIVGHDRQDL